MIWWWVLEAVGVPAAVVALAIGVARYTAKKAIDQRFESATQTLKHKHDKAIEDIRGENARDVERLRGDINTSLDRVTKLHNFEYETLPEAWRLLHVALGDASDATRWGLIESPDVASMKPEALAAFVEGLPWDQVCKDDLLGAADKPSVYSKYKDRYDLGKARQSHAEFHNHLIEKGIFIHPELRDALRAFANDINTVLVERKTMLEMRGDGSFSYMTADQIGAMHAKTDTFLKARSDRIKSLEEMVQGRLWSVRVS